jgi:putative intracellular protease/amidase
MTGFSNAGEEAVGLTRIVASLIGGTPKEKGRHLCGGADRATFVVQDGLQIAGQNPASSAGAASRLMAAVKAAG